MQRTVPQTISEAIELYIRTYYSLLRSSGEFRIRSLEETYEGMDSSLHLDANKADFDSSAFYYAAQRLPNCINTVDRILLGQSEMVFYHNGLTNIREWQRVDTSARRRLMLYNGVDTIAAFVSSVSDIDDLIPLLTCYQIEWNKLHTRLVVAALGRDIGSGETSASIEGTMLQQTLEVNADEMEKLYNLWGRDWDEKIRMLATRKMDFRILSYAGGLTHYRRAMQAWWNELLKVAQPLDVDSRPIYFISSNPHSIVNLISGYAVRHKKSLLKMVARQNPENMAREMNTIFKGTNIGAQANFLYYIQRDYLRREPARQEEFEASHIGAGILHFENSRALDVSAQVIDLSKIDPSRLDPRLRSLDLGLLKKSRALIINIDYPLGFAAFHLFSQISSSTEQILGAYIMGKAASLNGRVGDVMLPNVVYDEHSKNTFLFKNCFQAEHIAPYLIYGTVFDNQKAVTVRGTFLQNREFMKVFYNEGYTVIEMEAGPYLSAIYEDIYPKRFPTDEIVNIFINAQYDIGMVHYASDTPYNRRKHLLSNSMSYYGVDATYACSIAILERIFKNELLRLGSK